MFQYPRSFSFLQASALGIVLVVGGGVTGWAQSSDFNLSLHADSHTSAADVGLPAYPGATLAKNSDDKNSGADLGFEFGDVHFRLKVANYVTKDSAAQILAFYRKPLSRFGEVLECNHGKPVGALTVTHSGLTCSDEHGGGLQVNGSPNSSKDHELRAGSPNKLRVVGIDESHPEATRFGLVYLEIPKDKEEKTN